MKKGFPDPRTTSLSPASNECDDSKTAASKTLALDSSVHTRKFPADG
jgi:hypothetical protein